jgi:hypothetical protein
MPLFRMEVALIESSESMILHSLTLAQPFMGMQAM